MGPSSLVAVVLAAGRGTRMRSSRPKPLHRLCGRAMLGHVLDAVAAVPADRAVVVVGHPAERVTKSLIDHSPPRLAIDFVEQAQPLGTGDAMLVALTALPDDDIDGGDVIVLPGDAPLVRPATLAGLAAAHREAGGAATVLTSRPADPSGYGRVVRGRGGRVARIVEEADATPDQAAIGEVATSIYCFRRGVLAPALRRVRPDNAKGENYLTDVIGVLADAGYPVASVPVEDPQETTGVNDLSQLAAAEAALRHRINRGWMLAGVSMVDPGAVYLDASVRLAPDVSLLPGTVLGGGTVVGAGAVLGPDTHLVDCTVGEGAVVRATAGTEAEIGAGAHVGPFAYLAPGTVVPPGSVAGPSYT
ncbi:MAG: NTP transferase domain-containing protein [Acidimicrobiales bacterium]